MFGELAPVVVLALDIVGEGNLGRRIHGALVPGEQVVVELLGERLDGEGLDQAFPRGKRRRHAGAEGLVLPVRRHEEGLAPAVAIDQAAPFGAPGDETQAEMAGVVVEGEEPLGEEPLDLGRRAVQGGLELAPGEIELAAAAGALVDLLSGVDGHHEQGAVDLGFRERLDVADDVRPGVAAGIGGGMKVAGEPVEPLAAPVAEVLRCEVCDEFSAHRNPPVQKSARRQRPSVS